MARTPLFLERRRYRQRRLMDAVRLLPLLGLILWMVPLMWPVPQSAGGVAGVEGAGGDPGGISVASALTYVFGIWAAMILAGLLLWWRTRGSGATDDTAD